MDMSLLDAGYADSRDNIQLEAAYKAFQDGTGKGGRGPSLQEKQNKATRDQIRRAQRLGEDLIREDLCEEDDISASQEHDTPGSPSPYQASFSQTTKERLSLTFYATCTYFSSVFKLNFNRIFKYIFNLVSNTRPHKHVFCFNIGRV